VLSLANLSSDPAQDYFADEMTEELITQFSKLGDLKVISRTSVMQYKGTRKSLPQIARERYRLIERNMSLDLREKNYAKVFFRECLRGNLNRGLILGRRATSET